jgi:hypothetical protein
LARSRPSSSGGVGAPVNRSNASRAAPTIGGAVSRRMTAAWATAVMPPAILSDGRCGSGLIALAVLPALGKDAVDARGQAGGSDQETPDAVVVR